MQSWTPTEQNPPRARALVILWGLTDLRGLNLDSAALTLGMARKDSTHRRETNMVRGPWQESPDAHRSMAGTRRKKGSQIFIRPWSGNSPRLTFQQ